MTALVKRFRRQFDWSKMGCAAFSKQSCEYRVCLFIRSKKAQQYKILLFVLFALKTNRAHRTCTKRHPKWAVAYEQNYEMFFINETKFMGTTECDKNNVIT